MMHKTPLKQAFEKVDERWMEAFGGKELRLSGQEGLEKFRKCLAGAPRLVMSSPSRMLIGCTLDTVKWMLEIQNMGLMDPVISESLQSSVSLSLPRSCCCD
jgi:hypothetical protein